MNSNNVRRAVVWFEKWDPTQNKPLTETSAEEPRRWQSLSQIASLNNCRLWRTGYSDQVLARVCLVDRLEYSCFSVSAQGEKQSQHD